MAGRPLSATIILRDAEGIDSIPERVVVLSEPSWQVKIGRGTMSGDEGLRPAEDNTWFDSRVMSRNHAILRANPDTRNFTIQDVGSMHGTHRNGRKLLLNTPENFYTRDTLVFGADVIRGISSFRALKVTVAGSWSDEEGPNPTVSFPTSYRNTFTADYSEEDMYDDPVDDDDNDEDAMYVHTADDDVDHGDPNHVSLRSDDHPSNWQDYYEDEPEDDLDDEVEIVKESIRAPSLEVVIPPRKFSVPDSEISDTSSYMSDNEVGESPTSSPVGPNDDGIEKRDASHSRNPFAARVDLINKLSPADVVISESSVSIPLTKEDEMGYSEPEIVDEEQIEDDEDEDGNHEESNDPMVSRPLWMHAEGAELHSTGNSTVQARSSEAARTPSPSDAAMVKLPSDYMPMAPPFHHNTSAFDEHPAHLCLSSHRDPAWAGHNYVLYDPVVRPGSDYENAYNTGQAFNGQCTLDASPINYSNIPTYNTFACDLPSTSETKVSSKCSIAQLLEGSKSDGTETAVTPSTSLKRKADGISNSTWEESRDVASSLGVNATGGVQQDTTLTSHNIIEGKLVGTRQRDANIISLSTLKELAGDTETPARKKAKMNKQGGSHAGGFMRMAAATMAGVAIGTVGTIIGLASLPQEYFL